MNNKLTKIEDSIFELYIHLSRSKKIILKLIFPKIVSLIEELRKQYWNNILEVRKKECNKKFHV